MLPEHFSATKLIPPVAGFFGAVIMLSYMSEIPRRHWAVALLGGVMAAYFVPPIVIAWTAHAGLSWLPVDGSVEGLLGLLLGMGAIHIVGALSVMGRRFAGDPTGFVRTRGRGDDQ